MSTREIGALLKPTSAVCNLRCDYCFYNEVPKGTDGGRTTRMSEQVLESFTRQYLELDPVSPLFAWQGGEPTQLGVGFFENALELQRRYARPGMDIVNTLQTNGTLIDEAFAAFLARERFLVGVSLDGPREIHDRHRRDAAGKGTFDRVMRAVRLLQKAGAEFNILCVVHNDNVRRGREMFRFFMDLGVRFVQFIPCVERTKDCGELAPFSVRVREYGDFLCEVFEEWAYWPDGPVSERLFDSVVMGVQGMEPQFCVLRENCHNIITVEANGDVYPCEFFVAPEWLYGNLMQTPLRELLGGEKRAEFEARIRTRSVKCKRCKWDPICKGGCPKYRRMKQGRFDDTNYFCKAYERLFEKARRTLRAVRAAQDAASAKRR